MWETQALGPHFTLHSSLPSTIDVELTIALRDPKKHEFVFLRHTPKQPSHDIVGVTTQFHQPTGGRDGKAQTAP